MNRLSSERVADLASDASNVIPIDWFVGMAKNESGFDADNHTKEPNGKTSIGLYQVNDEELAAVGLTGDLTDPWLNTLAFARLMERNLGRIAAAAGFALSSIPLDAWKYLAWSHNQGLAAVLASIKKYGLDWAAFVARPENQKIAYITQHLIPYVEHATAGIGAAFPDVARLVADVTGDVEESSMGVAGVILLVGLGYLVWRFVL